tara:strand:+ start:152 stop:424 length:273 start_codon:yes stop_codon:yes gene_type:complete
MTTKADIAKKISKDLNLPYETSSGIVNAFISIVKEKSKVSSVKISNFGTFKTHKSPERLGRNPKTKESYIIAPREKLIFRLSNKLKKFLN